MPSPEPSTSRPEVDALLAAPRVSRRTGPYRVQSRWTDRFFDLLHQRTHVLLTVLYFAGILVTLALLENLAAGVQRIPVETGIGGLAQVTPATAAPAVRRRILETLAGLSVMMLACFILLGLVVAHLRRTSSELGSRVEDLARSEARIRIINDRLVTARNEAMAASQSKTAFLASMSHELRTPLNAIIGFSEMLVEDATETGQHELASDLSKVLAAGRHLLALINDVLDLAKIEAGRMEIVLERFDVASLTREIESTLAGLARTGGNDLRVELDMLPGLMTSDGRKIRQILLNLLGNAIKFTRDGAVTLRVRAERTRTTDDVLFDVVDTGIGMTSDQIDRLFTSFSQGDPEISRTYGGTGLGLAISQRLCQMMGGQITVTSVAGSGSTFSVRLPRIARPAEGVVVVGRDPAATGADGGPGSVEPGREVVLVVDDDPDSRELAARLLQREGYSVARAGHGEEALRLARAQRPALILLDLEMPVMDGLAVLTELRADRDLAEVPVIALSTDDQPALSSTLGTAGFLTKPVDRDRLLEAVERARGQPAGRVLLVGRRPDATGPMAAVLGQGGWEVLVAHGRVEALARVEDTRPHIIVLDITMEHNEGFEFVRDLRQMRRGGSIPVIVITGREEIEEVCDQVSAYFRRVGTLPVAQAAGASAP